MMGGMGKAFSGMPRQEGQPDVGPMFERLARGLMDSMMAWQGIGTVVYDLVVYAPFPILLLWLIGRASAKNDLLPATI
jgi:hypothetical protein